MGIGYAYLERTLNIGGTVTVVPPVRVTDIFNDSKLGSNGSIDTTDSEQTFITGTNPNNYIWYSGKLWRAVSMDTSDNSVKLVTQWDQTAIPYNVSGNIAFSGSHAEMWLNDTGSDGFLGNLYNYSNFVKTDSKWNATLTSATSKPAKTTIVTDTVGLLNIYEYTMSYNGTTYSNGYLNNGLLWWTLTPKSSSYVWRVGVDGTNDGNAPTYERGIRPSINLKSMVKISGGDGTESNPYTLNGDSDSPSSGTLLNTRKSGEYINFGNGNIYRIVSIEDNKTKIVSSEPIKTSGSWKTLAFDSNSTLTVLYTPKSTTNIGYFLNNNFLNPTNGYITSSEVSMLETGNNWYLGTVGSGANYSLGKCTTAGINCTKNATSVTSTVGMLRLGEQLSGQFNRYDPTNYNTEYWILTPYSSSSGRSVYPHGHATYGSPTNVYGIRPSVNLKSTIKITSGSGTKQDPFTITS